MCACYSMSVELEHGSWAVLSLHPVGSHTRFNANTIICTSLCPRPHGFSVMRNERSNCKLINILKSGLNRAAHQFWERADGPSVDIQPFHNDETPSHTSLARIL